LHYIVNSVALNELYITCALLTSKLSGVRFCCLRGEKDKLYIKTARISRLTRTRIQNPHYCERLLLKYMRTRVYNQPYTGT